MIYEEEALVSYDVITGMTSGEFEIAIVGKFSTLEINYYNNNNKKNANRGISIHNNFYNMFTMILIIFIVY